jgi:hypothetical protein
MTQFTYQIITSGLGHTCIQRSDGAVIPESLDNADYQAYLKRDEAEQSTPSVIDEAEIK